MTDETTELAYGLLWIAGCDRSTEHGQALYLARKVLYERLDRDGQARGITAARNALVSDPPLRAGNYEDRHPQDACIWWSASDHKDLIEVVRELGIEDSHTTPAEAVRELNAEIERLHSQVASSFPATQSETK